MDGASKSASNSKVTNTTDHQTASKTPSGEEALTIAGADVNSTKKRRDIRLVDSLFFNYDEERAEMLIRKGADVNYSHQDGMTPLMAAARNGLTKSVKLLLISGADVNSKDKENNQALHFACQFIPYTIESIERLLEAGADVNSRNDMGKTPLFEAVNVEYHPHYIEEHNNHVKAVNILVKAGADVNAEAKDGTTSLIFAAELGYVKCTETLLEAGADVNRCTNDGITAVMMASYHCHYKCINILLAAGAHVNMTHKDGGNALLLLCCYKSDDQDEYVEYSNRYSKCIRSLLKAGIHINKFDQSEGKNALGTALTNRWWIQEEAEEIPEEAQFKNMAILLLYAAGETLEGTDELKIPEVLKFEDEKLSLKHMCREAIRQHLLKLDPQQHLFSSIPELGLPSALSKYLLFNLSLDTNDIGDKEYVLYYEP